MILSIVVHLTLIYVMMNININLMQIVDNVLNNVLMMNNIFI